MSMNLHTYIGPLIRIEKGIKDFDPWKFTKEIGEALYHEVDEASGVTFLLPNFDYLSPNSQIITAGKANETILDPNVEEDTKLFTEKVKEFTDKLEIPFTIHWGIFNYYS